MNQQEYYAWREAFRRDHGYYPEDDPDLAQKGFSQEQALGEHLQVLNWSQSLGRPAEQQDYERYWNQRYGGPAAAGEPSRALPQPKPTPPVSTPSPIRSGYEPWLIIAPSFAPGPQMRQGRYLLDFLRRYANYYGNTAPTR